MLISVVLCTYNRDDGFLGRVLDAISSQDLDPAVWELLIVDNNSSPPIRGRACVSARGIRVETESRQGLAAARECGTRNTRGDILVFVDDDNLIAPDYLRQVTAIFGDSKIGIVSGAISLKYEKEPAAWFGEWGKSMLGVRQPRTERTYLTNIPLHNAFFPIGAGMAIRREVIEMYYQSIAEGSRYMPGRVGSDLSSAEDLDLDFFALSQDYLIGTAGTLKMRHIIPPNRTTYDYIKRLAIASTKSAAEVNAKWANAFGGDVFDIFAMSERHLRLKCMLAALLFWIPEYRVRYHLFKTLLQLSRVRSRDHSGVCKSGLAE